MHSKPWEEDDISKKRKQVEEARQSLRSNPSHVTRHHLANASKALADMYVEKQTQFYAGIAEKVESASSEGKSKAAFRAINQLTGRKSRVPCGVESDSPADREKILHKHFQNLLRHLLWKKKSTRSSHSFR